MKCLRIPRNDKLTRAVIDTLLDRLRHHPAVRDQVPPLEAAVAAGETAPTRAALLLLEAFLGGDASGHEGSSVRPGP